VRPHFPFRVPAAGQPLLTASPRRPDHAIGPTPISDAVATWLHHGRRRLIGIAVAGVACAAIVAYLTSRNPHALPAHTAVWLRVAIILTTIGAGLYAFTNRVQARMGLLLVGAGFYSSLWLLNGSAEVVPFNIGVLVSAVSPAVFAFLLVAFPTGRLASAWERRTFLLCTIGLIVFWLALRFTTRGVQTPLLYHQSDLPRNLLFVNGVSDVITDSLEVGLLLIWAIMVCSSPLLIEARLPSLVAAHRRAIVPVRVLAIVFAVLFVAFVVARLVRSSAATGVGGAYVAVAFLIPVGVLVGLALERLFFGQALAEFATNLVQMPFADPEKLMADALGDPTLRVAYRRPTRDAYVDYAGHPVPLPGAEDGRAVSLVERNHRPVAAVIYDSALADEGRFIQGAGAIAIIRLEGAQLEADLRASTRELAASRIRLVEAADAERQRIERDLHDGVQQDLVGLRIKLDLAAELLSEDRERGEQMIASIGKQMEELLRSVRALARGVYPIMLTERGLSRALASVAQRSAAPVRVRARGIGRYEHDIEVAVYLCCLEAMQNAAKHAGGDAECLVRLWENDTALHFEVSDQGVGFDPAASHDGRGLVNMRDRISAVGGQLTIASQVGHGTTVYGSVPLSPNSSA
jgi:signal transduction histidine kinase